MSQKENLKYAYLAGFLDGDGSIHVRIKPNQTYRFGFQIAPYVVFYQSVKEFNFLTKLQKEYKIGYLRKRNDGVCEWIVGDKLSIVNLVEKISPHLQLKQKQAKLLLKIILFKDQIKNAKDFLGLTEMIDEFGKLNYSKKRKITSRQVKLFLEKQDLLSP